MTDGPAFVLAHAPIVNPTGLHARPSIKLTKIAKASPAHVEIALAADGPWIDAKSPVKVMRFRAPHGAALYFRASGEGAGAVVDELIALTRRNFDEDGEESAGENGTPTGAKTANGAGHA